MAPSDANSPLATLRQLKEMLDAGTITPQEFEALKQQLVFGKETPAPPAAPDSAAPPALEPEPPTAAPAAPRPASAEPPAPVPTDPPPAAPTETPEWLSAPAPMLLTSRHPPLPTDPDDPAAERRNPLTLVFAVGGALVLLAIVLYLALGSRTENEHLTSASQTAADSTAVVPEVGPQAEQLTLPPAPAPETVRVAPATLPPAAPAAATRFRADSAATPAAPVKPAPATSVIADSATQP